MLFALTRHGHVARRLVLDARGGVGQERRGRRLRERSLRAGRDAVSEPSWCVICVSEYSQHLERVQSSTTPLP